MIVEELEGIAEEVARQLEGRVDEYVVIVERGRREMLKLSGGEATVYQSWDTVEVSVYTARRDGRILLTELSTPAPGASVDEIIRLLDKVEPSPLYAPLPSANGESYRSVDPAIISHLEGVETLDLGHDLEIESVGDIAGMALLGAEARVFRNSYGDALRGEKTFFQGYARVFRGSVSGQWSWTSTSYGGAKKARRAIQVARELADECASLPLGRIEPGEYRLLMSPMVAGSLIDTLVRMTNAASIIFGSSFIRPENVGERIFSDILTVRDEPRNPALPGYALHDDEGVATRDKYVVRRGVLETLLHNTKTAKLMGHETTGNAGLIMPRPFNVVVEPGDVSSGELLEALGTGVYATNIWYTRFQNFVEGAFSTVTRDAAFLVKNGRPVECLQRFRITGRMRDLFSSIEAAGKEAWDLEWWEIPVPTRAPHLLAARAGISSV